MLVILENLVDLDAPLDDASKPTEVEFIKKDNEEDCNYGVIDLNINAADYGSWAERRRKIFVCIDATRRIRIPEALSLVQEFVVAMECEWRMDASDVLFSGDDFQDYVYAPPHVEDDSREKKVRFQLWQDEHRVMFEHARIEWPPQLASSDINSDHMRGDGRMQQAAFFYHTVFPLQQCGEWECVGSVSYDVTEIGFPQTIASH